jgi:hypothetical protein
MHAQMLRERRTTWTRCTIRKREREVVRMLNCAADSCSLPQTARAYACTKNRGCASATSSCCRQPNKKGFLSMDTPNVVWTDNTVLILSGKRMTHRPGLKNHFWSDWRVENSVMLISSSGGCSTINCFPWNGPVRPCQPTPDFTPSDGPLDNLALSSCGAFCGTVGPPPPTSSTSAPWSVRPRQ